MLSNNCYYQRVCENFSLIAFDGRHFGKFEKHITINNNIKRMKKRCLRIVGRDLNKFLNKSSEIKFLFLLFFDNHRVVSCTLSVKSFKYQF